ncbi:LppX_LprAFG lipoprotein [Nocardioides sp. BP30]|uniref:LppX_LprAFG lipoprotein n=1 Tax=Nocardioides sp. BP30 TaxID=3036374 RepID=UPI00246940C9|nr:LppX_LprAFG lipoprotein [Nocardioides sp. BP30]WGL54194.1 LppX_LprAFG lipoprotein [Nocardioides sp. BP30]
MLRRTALSLVVTALPVLALSACGGGSGAGAPPPAEAIAQAKSALDHAAGVQLHLVGKDLPSGNVLVGADGTLTRAPAFDGTIAIKVLGATAQVPVVSVDDKVYAKLPLTTSWQTIDPAQYGVPDPATLIAPDTGISRLLTATTDLKKGDTVRGGKDNKQVLTTYTGTLPASAVAAIISQAAGTFAVSYTIDDDHRLEQAAIRGRFYGADTAASTYTVTLDDYGVTKTITKP